VGAIWDVMSTLIEVGASVGAGVAQNRAMRKAGDKSFGLAMLQRSDQLAQYGEQNAMAAQQGRLAKEGLAFQKSEARRGAAERKERLKQDKIDRMLGMLGTNTALQKNVVDMWSNTGIMGG